MTTISNMQSPADHAESSGGQASTSSAAAWQLSPHQLDAARKVLQHVQRSMTSQAASGTAQTAPAQR